MRDDSRFFHWLGRINSVLFFLGALALLAVAIGAFWGESFRAGPERPEKARDGETYAFGGNIDMGSVPAAAIARLEGSDEAYMVLQRGGERHGSFRSDSRASSANVNVLLFDLDTMRSRWMFQGLKQDIGPSLFVRAVIPAPNDTFDPVVGVLMPVATADTDGDGVLTSADDHSLYVYRPEGVTAVKLIAAKLVSSMQQIDNMRVLVTYNDGKTERAAVLATKDFSVTADAQVPPPPPK